MNNLDILIDNALDVLNDGDYLVISETPISLSQGRIVDESEFESSILSIFLAKSYGGVGCAIGTSISLIIGNIIIKNQSYGVT